MPNGDAGRHKCYLCSLRFVQRGKQGCCSVAFVVVGYSSAAPLLLRPSGLLPAQRLDLALLFSTEHDPVLGRAEIQLGNGFQLYRKFRIVVDVERSKQGWL